MITKNKRIEWQAPGGNTVHEIPEDAEVRFYEGLEELAKVRFVLVDDQVLLRVERLPEYVLEHLLERKEG